MTSSNRTSCRSASAARSAEAAAVRVAVELRDRALDRLDRAGERPERPLVEAELDDPLEPQLALDLLDGLARLVRDEPDERADRRRCTSRRAHRARQLGAGASTRPQRRAGTATAPTARSILRPRGSSPSAPASAASAAWRAPDHPAEDGIPEHERASRSGCRPARRRRERETRRLHEQPATAAVRACGSGAQTYHQPIDMRDARCDAAFTASRTSAALRAAGGSPGRARRARPP